MTEKNFQQLPGLDFDPESTQRRDFETRERQQSFEHVRLIFQGVGYVLGVVVVIWIALMCNSLGESMPKEAFYLHMAKASLCTVTLLTLCVSLLRFALHGKRKKEANSKEEDLPDATSLVDSVRKIVETVSRSSSSQ